MHKRSFEKVSWRSRVSSFRNILELIILVWRAGPTLVTASVLLRVIRSALPVTVLWITKCIIDSVINVVAHQSSDIRTIWKFVILDAVVYLCGDLFRRCSILIESILADRVLITTNVKLMKHAMTLDLQRFEDPEFQDHLERARQESSGRITLFKALLTFLQDAISVLLLSSGLLIASPWLLILLLVSVLPTFLGEARLAAMEYSILFRRTPQRRRLDYLRFLCASLYTIKEVSLFSLGDYLVGRYLREWEAIYRENKAMAIHHAWIGSLLNLAPTVGYYGGYAFILLRTIGGSTSVGSFMFLTRAFSRSCNIIERMFANVGDISDESLRLGHLFHIFSVTPAVGSSRRNLPIPRPIAFGFEFRNVSFKYPGTDRWVLRNVTFFLERSQRISLVGPNGAGKSTIAKLIARMYDPTEGQVLLDGVDLRDYEISDLRANITAVFQDYVRYDLSVAENIAFGEISKLDDLPCIEEAAQKTQLRHLISSLPGRYGQQLGRRFEGGIDISGGEWQRLALARASMRSAQLWILDEPTATLDPRAEYRWFANFIEMTKNSSCLLISHRFSTIRLASKILVLGDGVIREEGSHEHLLGLRGRYARMFQVQASGYR